jgi:hypothetical protein
MSQIFHIFKKDIRHLWPEILISLALTIAFVRASLGEWSQGNGGSPYLSVIADLIVALVPVGWWVLSARLIHDESLVGENQFWTTRPYQWQKLLAAKALFLLVFLYLPLFIAQVVLLASAGFHPFHYLPGLLYNLVLITVVLILPIAVIATVTSNFSRLVLTTLGAVVYLSLIVWAVSSIPFFNSSSFPNPYANKVSFALISFVFLLVIALQYATRFTWRSRWLLLSLPFLLIVCFAAWPIQTLARRLYPPADGQPPIQFSFDPDPERLSTRPVPPQAKYVDLYLPLAVSGIPSETLMRELAVQVSVEAPDGQHWNSNWQDPSQNYLPSDTTRSSVAVPIDPQFLQRIRSTPVVVNLTFALVQLRAGATTTALAGDQDFTIPGNGICSVSQLFGTFPECRFAMSEPGLTFVTARWSNGPCSKAQPGSGTLGNVWLGAIDPAPAEFGLDPVKIKRLPFSNRGQSSASFICPGTPITTTPYSVVRRVRTHLVIPNVDLTQYTVERSIRGTRSSLVVAP